MCFLSCCFPHHVATVHILLVLVISYSTYLTTESQPRNLDFPIERRDRTSWAINKSFADFPSSHLIPNKYNHHNHHNVISSDQSWLLQTLPLSPHPTATSPTTSTSPITTSVAAATMQSQHAAYCSANNIRYLYNVLIEGKKIIFFHPHLNSSITLPPIKSYLFREEIFFNMQVEVRNSTFRPHEQCLSYFPGTLHVMKRSTTHNIYHSGNTILSLCSCFN